MAPRRPDAESAPVAVDHRLDLLGVEAHEIGADGIHGHHVRARNDATDPLATITPRLVESSSKTLGHGEIDPGAQVEIGDHFAQDLR